METRGGRRGTARERLSVSSRNRQSSGEPRPRVGAAGDPYRSFLRAVLRPESEARQPARRPVG